MDLHTKGWMGFTNTRTTVYEMGYQAHPLLSNTVFPSKEKEWTSFIPEIIATDSAFNEITPSFALLQSILLLKSQSSCSICMIFLKMIFDISRYTEDYISIRKQSTTRTLPVTCINLCHFIHCLLSEERFLMLRLSSSCLFDIVLSHYAWAKYYLVSLVY